MKPKRIVRKYLDGNERPSLEHPLDIAGGLQAETIGGSLRFALTEHETLGIPFPSGGKIEITRAA